MSTPMQAVAGLICVWSGMAVLTAAAHHRIRKNTHRGGQV